MTSLIQNIIQEKRRRIFEGKDLCAVSRDLIDVLMSNGSDELSLTDELISDNMIDFMIPAEDSVPVLITLAIKYLSECPLALQQLEVRYIYALKWFLLLIVTKFGCLRREVPGMGSGFEIPVRISLWEVPPAKKKFQICLNLAKGCSSSVKIYSLLIFWFKNS